MKDRRSLEHKFSEEISQEVDEEGQTYRKRDRSQKTRGTFNFWNSRRSRECS